MVMFADVLSIRNIFQKDLAGYCILNVGLCG